jgi:hypothetical protein
MSLTLFRFKTIRRWAESFGIPLPLRSDTETIEAASGFLKSLKNVSFPPNFKDDIAARISLTLYERLAFLSRTALVPAQLLFDLSSHMAD